MDMNEINVELSENFQRYVNECCESESDGKIDGVHAGCCKCRGGGVAIAVYMMCCSEGIGGSQWGGFVCRICIQGRNLSCMQRGGVLASGTYGIAELSGQRSILSPL
jgi:hypothetical protein